MRTWADLAVVEIPETVRGNGELDGMSVVQSSNFTIAIGLQGGQFGLVDGQVVVARGQDALALLHDPSA